ncbi:TetR/AcrR family transcriptional regulator [Acanthopleuribacter pedis]|uniref:TetR/AcrR family transcriptional regulator n=1 Tax=Acanthopleuribacter pedis TaxID=442870 RepID=A0A8J7Q519_9BACT|nr:TetR/AcrR family transcriptional regulator [Acanthopleuribacter pedis]MBO1320557.1 TetR/AcrR family transcriptional regulator [Acanthopleuribacter pedis]
MGTAKDSEQTRARIIEAAGRLFAERGFKGVTVRMIAKEAETHLSALNYHFQSKQILFHEVLMHAAAHASISAEEKRLLKTLKPREALFVMVKEVLEEGRREGAGDWRNALLARESHFGGEAYREVIEHYYRPDMVFATELVAAAAGSTPDSRHVQFAVLTMVSLLETFGLHGHMAEEIVPGFFDDLGRNDQLSRHIVAVTLAAANPELGGV